ncbi:MAG: orc1/cdc6 family replication initiation protein [Candidatus Nanoarchaeia archaeon]|nr:orc1/cdc6 family replication initiation protein [Candidatus Nanoarchaeia archaeon]
MKEIIKKNIFKSHLNETNIFSNKKVLQSNYFPEEVFHREEEINTIADILSPALNMDKPSNIFIYGKTGTGKTLTVKHTTEQLVEIAQEEKLSLKVIYINCKLKKVADTEYRLLASLIEHLGEQVPTTGLPTDKIYDIFYKLIDKKECIYIIILDEIDQLVKKIGDELLYNLTRINSELKKAQITLIGIANDLTFTSLLDARVKSSLSEEEVLFDPYNAVQIKTILKDRVDKGFVEDSVPPGVVAKCAAFAAREHGDVRRAIELLRIAGEIAQRSKKDKVTIEDLDEARDKIDKDNVFEAIKAQPKQQQAVIYAIIKNKMEKKQEKQQTGQIYGTYTDIVKIFSIRPLTQRRISDIISELDTLGLINQKVISKGRYGRTTEISINFADNYLLKIKEFIDESIKN